MRLKPGAHGRPGPYRGLSPSPHLTLTALSLQARASFQEKPSQPASGSGTNKGCTCFQGPDRAIGMGESWSLNIMMFLVVMLSGGRARRGRSCRRPQLLQLREPTPAAALRSRRQPPPAGDGE